MEPYHKEKTRVIAENISSLNLEEKPLLSTSVEGYSINLHQQKKTDNLWFVLAAEETGVSSHGLILKREDGSIWTFVGSEEIWFIFGLIPEEAAITTFEANGSVRIMLDKATGVFLATTVSPPPIKLLFKDSNEVVLQIIDIPLMPESDWFVRLMDRLYTLPHHLPWYKPPEGPVPLTRRWYN